MTVFGKTCRTNLRAIFGQAVSRLSSVFGGTCRANLRVVLTVDRLRRDMFRPSGCSAAGDLRRGDVLADA